VPRLRSMPEANAASIPTAVIAARSTSGDICLYTLSAAHLLVDASGWFPTGPYDPFRSPQRLFDSRPGSRTADGTCAGEGAQPGRSTLELQLGERVGVPKDASVVVHVVHTGNGRTHVTLHVSDVAAEPGRIVGAHEHQFSCGTSGAEAGPHCGHEGATGALWSGSLDRCRAM
jgi:hypothetical protein